MKDQLKIVGQYILPKHLLSRLTGKLAAAKAGKVTTFLVKKFIAQYKINMSEAKHPEPEYYETFNDFFTRELKQGARTIIEGDANLATPVD